MDLLKIIQALPVDAIGQSTGIESSESSPHAHHQAVNSLPCLSKIRFVASELLNELESPSLVLEPDPNDLGFEDGRQRAVKYLCKSTQADLNEVIIDVHSQIPLASLGNRKPVHTRKSERNDGLLAIKHTSFTTSPHTTTQV